MIKLKYIFFVLWSLCILNTKAQVNLVPNPSFENMKKPCDFLMGISATTSWLDDWFVINIGTIEYLNTCSNTFSYPTPSSVPLNCKGYQLAQHKNGYIGMCLYSTELNLSDTVNVFCEYLSVKLNQTLKKDNCYYGEMYANLGNNSLESINQISMLLTPNVFTTSIGSFTNSIQPQIQWDTTQYFNDTLNWVKISGTFIAQGGEEYLTIGNFRDGAHLKKKKVNSNFSGMIGGSCGNVNPFLYAYYNVDNITLYELLTPQLGALNYTICNNSDSLVLGDTARLQTTYQWFANGLLISTSNTIIVKPTQTTNYVLQSTQCGISSQTITVTYSTNCEPVVVIEPIIPNVFTPNNDGVNDVWQFTIGIGNTISNYSIYNRWGLEVGSNPFPSGRRGVASWNGYTTSGIECTAGVYFYVLEYLDVNGDTHKKNGYISLIR